MVFAAGSFPSQTKLIILEGTIEARGKRSRPARSSSAKLLWGEGGLCFGGVRGVDDDGVDDGDDDAGHAENEIDCDDNGVDDGGVDDGDDDDGND